jgi:hypothetical protein
MTAANDVELVRVYITTDPGTPQRIADQTVGDDQPFAVVLEAEAGQTLHQNGGPYGFSMVARDLTDGTTITSATQNGSFGDGNWPNLKTEFLFPNVPAQGAGKRGHVCEVIAVLTAGSVNQNVDFARSDPFIITKP